jgi:hypothetical protein
MSSAAISARTPVDLFAEPVQRGDPVQGLPRRKDDLEVVQVPLQPVDHPGPLRHQVLAVIEQESDLQGLLVEMGLGQVGLAQRRAGHGQCVDRIGLAAGAG